MDQTTLLPPSMTAVFRRRGTPIQAVGHRPMVLWDRDAVCWVASGHLDFFIVRRSAEGVARGPLHWCRGLSAGGIFFCDAAPIPEIGLVARGVQHTEVWQLDRETFSAALGDQENPGTWLGAALHAWSAGLLARLVEVGPARMDRHLENDERALEIPRPGTYTVSMRKDHGLWLQRPDAPVTPRLAGDLDTNDGAADLLPLDSRLWYTLTAETPASLKLLAPTEALPAPEMLWDLLHALNRTWGRGAEALLHRVETEAHRQFEAQKTVDQQARKRAVAHFADVMSPGGGAPPDTATAEDALLIACGHVGRAMGVTFTQPADLPADESLHTKILLLGRAAGVRPHKVKLTGTWYTEDLAPMVAFRAADGLPLAILPAGKRSYRLIYPDGSPEAPLTAETAGSLEPHAYMFFPSIPDGLATPKALVKIALDVCRPQIRTILATGFCAGGISLLVPVVTNKIISDVIPGNHYHYLYQIMLGLIAAAVGSTIFELFKAVALLRTTFKAEARIQPALWDRLLKLPIPFFSTASAGDIANRANSLMEVSNQLKGTVVTMALAGIFASVNFLVMFHYHKKLAFCGLGLVLAGLGLITGLGWCQMRGARRLYDIQGRISGLVLQLTNGISKLKTAGAEWRAYERWAALFAEQKRADLKSRRFGVWQQTVSKVYDPLTRMLIIALLVFQWKDALTPGEYTAFNTAMGAFVVAVLSVGPVMEYLSSIVLLFSRVDPILAASPEPNLLKAHPGTLSGRVEVSNVTFSYRKDGPRILKGVSLEAQPGEFVAIVGESGSGKSTLLRLMLGFETPDTGGIFFDGQDLSQLDLDSVRHQMGVVLQNGSLMPGDIFTNIVGASPLTIDDAWRAARRAGLEPDIKAMSMGMYTVVPENARTFSGGQRQRMMIARAIVNEPRLLLFDEATSALDNTTQAIVARSVRELNATRIVVAHRLSTIMHADRIYVMAAGRVVQTGTYAELMAVDGPFRRQAKRQMV
jgi:ATP-binding cassette subfamily C protein